MIIAEIGQNFCGDDNLALRLINLAQDGGADLVKFQLYDHNKLYKGTDIPNCELSFEQAKLFFEHGQSVGVEVFFSVFDVERVKWCEEIGVKRYKIALRERNGQVLSAIAKTGKPIIVSSHTGEDIGTRKFLNAGNSSDWFNGGMEKLFCIGRYPTELDRVKFKPLFFENAITNSSESYGYIKYDYDGFSDHTVGLDVSKIALARGAKIIEKHFCLDHETGIDAEWSMDYKELKELKRWHDLCQKVL